MLIVWRKCFKPKYCTARVQYTSARNVPYSRLSTRTIFPERSSTSSFSSSARSSWRSIWCCKRHTAEKPSGRISNNRTAMDFRLLIAPVTARMPASLEITPRKNHRCRRQYDGAINRGVERVLRDDRAGNGASMRGRAHDVKVLEVRRSEERRVGKECGWGGGG